MLSKMTGCERAKGEPERRRMRELEAQFVSEDNIVERNQHDPVRQTDNAYEQEPHKHTAENGCRPTLRTRLVCGSRSARGIIAATIAATAIKLSNQ